MKAHVGSMEKTFINFKKENKHTDMIRKGGFHAGFSLGLGFEPIIMKRFDIP